MVTVDFIECEATPVGEYHVRDTRNGIICYRPGKDPVQSYMNYIDLLNLHRSEWKSTGYLDLGMMPLVMGPSFLQDILVDAICDFASKLKLQVYTMPPVSMMFAKCNVTTPDIWVFKKDIAKIMGLDENARVSFSKFMRWCLNEDNGN